jgi:hypothetical protein
LTSSAANGQIVVDAETYVDVMRAYPDARESASRSKASGNPSMFSRSHRRGNVTAGKRAHVTGRELAGVPIRAP